VVRAFAAYLEAYSPRGKYPTRARDIATAIREDGNHRLRIETTRLEITTDEGVSIADMTAEVSTFIRSTGVREGLCVMTVGRHECFLSLAPELEDAFDDMIRLVRDASLATLAEAGDESLTAADRADVDTSKPAPPGFLAESLSFAVREGSPELGSWEAILLVDGGGPARRAVDVTVMGATHTSART
jgi:thiamine phosphate synthase YjbQ (UPF0047 family)